MNRDIIEQILRDYEAFRRPDTDPELEAVRSAILIEDVFDVTLSDADIDQALFGDGSAIAALVARLRGVA